MVEKYEQMLAQDPTSTVFVELARAYLERGENEKAISLCQQGCLHHPGSVVGRVLWGKGLINVGRAAEAMKQFDLATNIDKENAHAYNLIGEVLLRKGLYRSALPILRKAAALQPNDGRITQWLEQTRTALSGGPAPVLYDNTTVDTRPVDERTGLPVDGPPASAPRTQPVAPRISPVEYGDEPPTSIGPSTAKIPSLSEMPAAVAPDPFGDLEADTGEKTVIMQAYVPEQERERAIAAGTELSVTTEIPTATSKQLFSAFPSGPLTYANTIGPPVPVGDEAPMSGELTEGGSVEPRAPFSQSQTELPVVMGQVEPGSDDAPDPFSAMMPPLESNETFRGLTSTFEALEHQRQQAPVHADPDGPPMLMPVVDDVGPAPAPAAVSVESTPTPAPAAASRNLLDDIVSAQSEIPTGESRSHSAALPAGKASAFGGGLLDEIPDEAPAPVETHRAEFSTQATEAIAKEYEQELRAKLEANTKKKTFLQKHGVKVAVIAAAIVVLVGAGGSFIFTRHSYQGENLQTSLAKGQAAINADTKEQYLAGLQSMQQAVTMDDSSAEAWAWSAYAHAMLFAEHNGGPGERNAALTAISKPDVRNQFADLAAVVDFLTADPANVTAARQQLLGSTLEQSMVLTQAGKVLLGDQKLDDAFKKLSKAVDLNSKNVRALVLLGDYYLASSDSENAMKVLGGTAEQLSKYHPHRVLGLAQARIELARELPEALADLEGLRGNATVAPEEAGRYALLLGAALSANAKHEEALKTLNEGLAAHADQAFEYQMALGHAFRNAGQMDRAQKGFEEALHLDPKREEAKEGLGRVLLARSREKELLERVKAENDAKRVSLVRGIAFTRLGDFKKARVELAKTSINGKYPAEAAVYLAIADASEEQGDKSIQLLEKLASQTKRHKATVQLALARIYMQRNMLDKARAQLEDASKDPQDYEANTQLAELLLNAGLPFDVALEPLTRAVERNGSHAPARHLLARTYTAMGRYSDAVKQVEAWVLDNPALELAWKDAAFVYFHVGRTKDAESAIAKGVRADSDDIDGWRLKAQILFARADAKNAFSALERANKLNAKDAETFCEIGNAYVRQGNNDVALKAYEAARREDPKSFCGQAGPHHARPSAKGKPSPHDELAGLVKSASSTWDRGFAQAALARVMIEERDLKGALVMAQEATQTAPASAQAWFSLGEVSKRMKNESKALEAYQKATEFDGSWSTARLAYADTLLRSGGENVAKSLPEYEAVLTLSQNDADVARAKKTVLALKKQLK